MTASQPRRRKGKPFNPALIAYQARITAEEDAKRRDRKSRDLLRNADVAPMEISDPSSPGEKIIAMRSLRNDPLANLHARHHIDEAQYQAGRKFQSDFEAAERGPRAIDPSKEAVDGGQTPEPITERQWEAGSALKLCYEALGPDLAAISHDVLIHGLTCPQISKKRGLFGRRWDEYFGGRIQDCLHRLSHVYGFAIEPTGKKRLNLSDN